MNIRYQKDLDGISWERIAELFQSVGWGIRNPVEIERAFMESSHVRVAQDGSNIIAFGRTVDDGKYYALIVDLVVDPMYQGRGIGKKILEELCDELRDYNSTTLTAARGKDNFYLKQGWKRQTSAFIWPRYPKQEEN
jgi:GNAT superfamily N-acetyltransferase